MIRSGVTLVSMISQDVIEKAVEAKWGFNPIARLELIPLPSAYWSNVDRND